MEQQTHDLGRASLYEQLARIGKVVVHPKRIELLELLCQGERSVEALAAATGLKLTTASAHLQVMRQARLVETRREATRVFYRAAGEEVCRFVGSLGDLARARLAEVEQILREIGADAPGTERVTRTELLARARAGDVVVLDVRPSEEYEAGHVPGAISLPLEHLEARLDELDPAFEVVAYCRGPLCLLAPQAVAALRERGRQARCLEDGMPEWRRAGLPVAVGVAAGGDDETRAPSAPPDRAGRRTPMSEKRKRSPR
ncbi:MAG TPA: metalloregulator ArsR/SmtB family transcription factor [Acidimicrobiales bacterium]|nr:metalloregulator ArsR/SmtB family transcription factor [Acidimicrobiales bacterium]